MTQTWYERCLKTNGTDIEKKLIGISNKKIERKCIGFKLVCPYEAGIYLYTFACITTI